jgi:hypothetical protein
MARLGPNRNVQLWMMTRDLPMTMREPASTPGAPAKSFLNVTTESTLMIPTTMNDRLGHDEERAGNHRSASN